MVRKQFYITAEQDRKLKERAKRLGVTEAEVIRRGIELTEIQEAKRLAAWTPIQTLIDDHLKSRPEGSDIDKFDRDEAYAEVPEGVPQ